MGQEHSVQRPLVKSRGRGNNIKNDFQSSKILENQMSEEESSTINPCQKCGRNMGSMNPRQLCGKTHCLYNSDTEKSSENSSKEANKQPNKNGSNNEVNKINCSQLTSSSDDSESSEVIIAQASSSETISSNKQTRIRKKVTIGYLKKFPPVRPLGVMTRAQKRHFEEEVNEVDDEVEEVDEVDEVVEYKPNKRKKEDYDNDYNKEDQEEQENDQEEYVDEQDDEEETQEVDDEVDNEVDDEVNDEETEEVVEEDSINNSEHDNDLSEEHELHREKTMEEYFDDQFDPKKMGVEGETQERLLAATQDYLNSITPTIPKVLKIAEDRKIPIDLFSEVIEHIIILTNIPRLSEEYVAYRDKINNMIDQLEELNIEQIQEYAKIKYQSNISLPTLKQILESNTSQEEKARMIGVLEKSRDIPTMYAMERLNIKNQQKDRLKYFNTATKEAVNVIEHCENTQVNSIENQLAEIKNHVPPKIFANILEELKQMRSMSQGDETAVKINQWLKYVVSMPYKTKELPVTTKDSPETIRLFILKAKAKLDSYISGMNQVKEQILDFIIARIHNPKSKRNIYGIESSPGMGKSTIGRAIADILELPFIEIRIGGQSDVAVLKGHSRTYIGAMPGQIVHKLSMIDYNNCVIFFDEIDKISTRGENEINSVLCELFDPDQNFAFQDYYLGFPIDLSGCLMVAAMNDRNLVSSIAIDRIQMLKIPNYTRDEKINMAITHLIPSAMRNLNIQPGEIIFTRQAVFKILCKMQIKEAGVRQFIRNIDNILKKLIKMKLEQTGLFKPVEIVAPVDEVPPPIRKNKRSKKTPVALPVMKIPQQVTITPEIIDEIFWEPPALDEPAKLLYV